MKIIQDIRFADREACLLDLYLPEDKKDFITVLLMHGGGLTGGSYKGKGFEVMAEAFARYEYEECRRWTVITNDGRTLLMDYDGFVIMK